MHAAPDTWPGCVEVIGRGRNYAEIEECIKSLHQEMDNRYKQLSSGAVAESGFSRVNIVIDEFTVLNKYCDVKDEISSILCECRKIGFTLCIGGQSDRVKSLGLEGAGDLIHGFEAVCYLEQASDGERYGNVKMGREKEMVKYLHPGVFHNPAMMVNSGAPLEITENSGVKLLEKSGEVHPESKQDSTPVHPEADSEKDMILRLHSEGKSVTAICLEVWGKKGSFYSAKVRAVTDNI